MNRFYLLSPPLYFAPAPLLAIPLLHGFLKNRNIPVETADLNIRFLHWLKNEDVWLPALTDKVIGLYNQFQIRAAADGPEAVMYRELAQAMGLLPKDRLKAGITGAVISGDLCEGQRDEWPQQSIKLMNVLKLLFPFLLGGAPSDIQKIMNAQGEYLNALNRYFTSPQADPMIRSAAAADIVGISVAFSGQQLFSAVLLARRIKELKPGCFVILGGPGLSMLEQAEKDQLLLSESSIDAIGLYGGERTLSDLAESPSRAPADLGRVANLLYRDPRSATVTATELKPPMDPDAFSTPVFDSQEIRLYHEFSRPWFQGVRLPVFVSDGCYWGKCAFCADHLTHDPLHRNITPRSVERVAEDIRRLQREYGATYFYLITSALIPQWVRRFCEQTIQDGRTASFWGYLRAGNEHALDNRFFHALKQAGFDMITVGVESAVDRVLTAVQKGNTLKDIRHTLGGLKRAGIKTKFNLIADLPPTTMEELSANEKFILDHIGLIDDLTVFRFLLYRGSIMAENPDAYGIRLHKDQTGIPIKSSQLSLRFDNPVLAGPGAEQKIGQLEKLGQALQFYKWTKALSERVSGTGFDWQSSQFIFRPFIALESHFGLEDGKAGKRTKGKRFLMHLDSLFHLAEIPGDFEPLLAVLKQSVQAPVSFPAIQEAFFKGLRRQSGDSGMLPGAQAVLVLLLYRFIQEGFVEEVMAEPCFKTIPVARSVPWERPPAERLHALGFQFFSTPFACVPALKMG